jgi:hypothetical protein
VSGVREPLVARVPSADSDPCPLITRRAIHG